MGKRGPRPEPTALLELKGSWQAKTRKDEVRPDTQIPTCPSWLSKAAKAEWKRLVPELKRYGLICPLDRSALALHCSAVAHYIEVTKTLGAEGQITSTGTGSVKAHPLVAIRDAAAGQIIKTCVMFGLSPADRVGLPMTPPTSKTDKLSQFLQEGEYIRRRG